MPGPETTKPTMNDSHPRLPPELTDIVIDHLADNISALHNCSMTCKSWIPRTRTHIFKEIRLSARNAEGFRTLIMGNNAIGKYIQEIHVHHRHSVYQPGPLWLEQDLLPQLSVHLQHVRKVVLGGDGTYSPSSFLLLSSIEAFETKDCGVESVDELLSLIASLPRLRSVVSRGTDYGLSKRPPQRLDTHPPSLRTLDFVHSFLDADVLLDWLVTRSMGTLLESVTAIPIGVQYIPHLGRMVRACAATLKHIRISVEDIGSHEADTWASRFTLEDCLELCVLEMDSATLSSVELLPFELSYDWIGKLLGQVRSPRIREVILGISQLDEMVLFDTVWDRVTNILTSSRFLSLSRLIIHAVSLDSQTEWRRRLVNRVKTDLADLDRRGLLVFEYFASPGEYWRRRSTFSYVQ
ncbi:hypothetical protein OBBRIDRAFT_550442 [Obba rivulosa]|uniref:F-box domain-containing protein n=1 Tax=Obba rivulosa TaxID=1052685 RepID=A0A8E2AZU2_9APHY|nr:hypothetical protein OBBRIDRAFT_550442 [Obba rivulosa]